MTNFRVTYTSFHRSNSAGIPKGAIAGIVVGILLGVIVFPVLGFLLWRRRRQKRNGRRFAFVEPSVHKGFDISEVLDIQPGGLGRRRKSPTQSLVSELSLELSPVTILPTTNPQSKSSPPTFPRSPTTSSPSQTQPLRDNTGNNIVHSPEAVDQHLGAHITGPLQVDSEDSPLPVLNRRGTVPKPSGPRPPSYRRSDDDPRTSAFIPLAQILTDPAPTKDNEPPEPDIQEAGEGTRTTIYSFLDMGSSSGPPSTIDGIGRSRNSTQPAPQVNLESPRHSQVTGTNSALSYRNSDRRESGASKPLSLSVVIQQPPTPKYPPSTEPHPYSPYFTRYRLTPQLLRPRTGERASPTDSVPITTSEISEIRFSHPGEGHGEPSGSSLKSSSDPQLSPLKATTSPIYKKLFGVIRGEVPPDGVLAKKRPLHRKTLSAPASNVLPRT